MSGGERELERDSHTLPTFFSSSQSKNVSKSWCHIFTIKSCGVTSLSQAGRDVDGEVQLLRQLNHSDVIAVGARVPVVLVVHVARHRQLLLRDCSLSSLGEVMFTNCYLEQKRLSQM